MFKKLALIATGAGLALAAVMMTAGADSQEVPAPEVVAPAEVTEAPTEVTEAVEPVESVPAVEAPAEVQEQDSVEVAPSCEERGLITAEDMTCVPADYYEAPAPELPTYTLPPCATEDSDNCYWNAATMGNGTGTSFINLDGVTYYAG